MISTERMRDKTQRSVAGSGIGKYCKLGVAKRLKHIAEDLGLCKFPADCTYPFYASSHYCILSMPALHSVGAKREHNTPLEKITNKASGRSGKKIKKKAL